MDKFCANPRCALHIDVESNVIRARIPRKQTLVVAPGFIDIARKEFKGCRAGKDIRLTFCEVCANAIALTI